MITAQQLEVRAGARLLMEDVTFRIAAGDKVGLVRRNGAGKTTLTRILAGEGQPASGTVLRAVISAGVPGVGGAARVVSPGTSGPDGRGVPRRRSTTEQPLSAAVHRAAVSRSRRRTGTGSTSPASPWFRSAPNHRFGCHRWRTSRTNRAIAETRLMNRRRRHVRATGFATLDPGPRRWPWES